MTTTSEIFNLASGDTRRLKSFVEQMHSMTGASGRLLYGRVRADHPVSLNPDIGKLKAAIGFVADYSFASGYENVIKHYCNG